MTAGQRLGLSLALCLGVGGALFVAAEWWLRKPAPPAVHEPTAGDARQARIEELQAAIEAQRTALGEVRQQRGMASDELERLTDELSLVRDRLEGLRAQIEGGEDAE